MTIATRNAYEAEQIARIAHVYHKLLRERDELNRALAEGPNALKSVADAREILAGITIPDYRRVVPAEIQRELNIDIDQLEEECSSAF